jgi:ATP-dependent Clp protease adaptor protein ClpS
MSDTAIKTRELVTTNLKPPSKYKVVVMNDDFTPMEFVIVMLMTIFKHSQENATSLTIKIHNEGSATAGIYTFEVAEQKAIDAQFLAREHGHPLQLRIEEE